MKDSGNSIQRKLSKFEEIIMKKALTECDDVNKEIDDYRAAEIEKYKDDMLKDTYDLIQSQVNEIRTETKKKISCDKLDFKKKLYIQRDQYNKLIFAEARIKLTEFTKSAEYMEFLLGKVQKLVDSCDCLGAKLLLKEDDLQYEAELRKICGDNLPILADEQILIGGAKLVSETKNYIADETLDTTLEEQKEWFAANSGFIVTM